MAPANGLTVLECPDCGTAREVALTPEGGTLRCQLCGHLLGRPTGGDSLVSDGATAMMGPISGIWGHAFSEVFRERYVLDRMLGEGAMGIVYHGRQVILDREVAVKFVKVVEPATVERFKRETKLLAKLNHPGIVEVYDGATEQGFPFLALEYVQGNTLKELLTQRGHLPPLEALAIMESIANALEYAHKAGIVHRDLKLANILMAGDTRPKIADFGLAKSLVAENEGRTHAGTILGTPAYMSPEQAQGRPVTALCDIYSAGVMLFELVTGRLPFIAPDVYRLVTMQVEATPPPLADLVDGPVEGIQEIIDVAMAKETQDRYRSARGLANAIRNQIARLSAADRTPVAAPAPVPVHIFDPAQGPPAAAAAAAAVATLAVPAAPAVAAPPASPGAAEAVAPGPVPAPAILPGGVPAGPGREPRDDAPGAHSAGLPTQVNARDGATQVLIPEGMIAMGSADGREDERPIKRVVVSAFWIDIHAVTNERYAAFQRATGARIAPWAKDSRFCAPDQPVVALTYDEALAYCRWAGGSLPTEAQFERAARGGLSKMRFAWGNEEPEGRAWFAAAGPKAAPAPVGRLAPNSMGLYDMAGNVWHWCLDYYEPSAYRDAVPRDPTGPRSGRERVIRGGCFSSFADQIRVAARGHAIPSTSQNTIGFRVVRRASE